MSMKIVLERAQMSTDFSLWWDSTDETAESTKVAKSKIH